MQRWLRQGLCKLMLMMLMLFQLWCRTLLLIVILVLMQNFDDGSLRKESLKVAQILYDTCPSRKYVAKKLEHKLRVNLKLM